MAEKKTDLKNLSFEELQAMVHKLSLEPFRTRQLFQWIFQKLVTDIGQATNISAKIRDKLGECARISFLEPERIHISRDGSKKFLFKTEDGCGIETVLIEEKNHKTICISTQIGCPMQCRFCRTGQCGLVRNLTAAEIVNQVGAVLQAEQLTAQLPNLVFMGMGEPLANYDQTVKSIKNLLSPWGLHFSHRKITVSTVGLVPQMKKLGHDLPVNLAVSLNAPNDRIRDYLIPLNRTYPIRDVLKAAQAFPLPARKRITFEYIIIKDVNDAPEHAHELGRLLRNIPCKINLIPFNEHPASDFRRPHEKRVLQFQAILHARHFTAPIRHSKGDDIAAACGQLGGSG